MTKRDLRNKIEFMVEAILDSVNVKHPHSMDELLHKKYLGDTNTLAITDTGNVSEANIDASPETTAFELLRASLGVIFLERYGWTDEAIDGMSLPEVFIALEHAMEYDAPLKKSVWNL